MSQPRLEELVPQLPDNPADKQAILNRAREIVLAFWSDGPDPVLAMALQVLVQIPLSVGPALAALDALQRAAQLPAELAA